MVEILETDVKGLPGLMFWYVERNETVSVEESLFSKYLTLSIV